MQDFIIQFCPFAKDLGGQSLGMEFAQVFLNDVHIFVSSSMDGTWFCEHASGHLNLRIFLFGQAGI